ncbi:MAG: hypothetical protein IKL89_08080, partial [Clostridia bacterium]|nr:hypothetical protein [Clostridia bacterium]
MRARTRVLSLVLAMVLICTMYMPTSVIAAETGSAEPEVTNYDDFFDNLAILEGYAEEYASGMTNAATLLVINFIRTGVERYLDDYWAGLSGDPVPKFVEFVEAKDAANGTQVMSLRNIVPDNFLLPNRNQVDFGHMFGALNILVWNQSVESQDIGGWAGDICDLLLYSKNHGNVPEGTIDEMSSFIFERCFGVDADNAFGWDDFYGDMDAFYFGTELNRNGGKLSTLMLDYFTADLTNAKRSAYFLNNRFDDLETREDVRNAVYNAYIENTAIELLEGKRDLTEEDADLRMAACYAFADYVFSLAEPYLDEPDNEGGSGEGEGGSGEGEGGSGEGE